MNWYVYCENNPVNAWDPSGYITDKEMQMYENGEMAPMAYTYLMYLTYNWYLSDDQEAKNYYHMLTDAFRATDYTTTNGVFNVVDEGIKYMASRPTATPEKEEHFFRNSLNLQFEWNVFLTLNSRLPDNLKWKELEWWESAFHKVGQGNNRKYVSGCEHFEVVYTKENYLVDENFSALNMGTYNYYGPTQANLHRIIDVEPYFAWGNTPKGWAWSNFVEKIG